MAYATEILNDSINKTKELFFPVRKGYWLRMGFVSLFSANGGSGGSSGSSGGNRDSDFSKINWKQVISTFNSEALKFLNQYGAIIGAGFFVLYLISLFFTYISSVFSFVFIDGVVKKDLKIRKSFAENKYLGSQIFFLRLVIGIIGMIVFVLLFLPLFKAFFSNTLADFNFWLIIPMLVALVIYSLVVGFFLFFVYDFVVPIMYLKKFAFSSAWKHFIDIAKNKKMEIFIYWLLKVGLSIASGIIILLCVLVLLIPLILVFVLLALIGVLIYFGLKYAGLEIVGIALGILLGAAILLFLVYAMAVLFVPISAFFTLYSVEMVKKLESKNKAEK